MSEDRRPAVLCAGCGQLVGANDAECLNCGRRRPARRGLGAFVAGALTGDAFVTLVVWACSALYLSSLAVDWQGASKDAGFDLLSPTTGAAVMFGASGGAPVFGAGRWWTVLSASWLHGGVLHIVFNMLWVRDLAPAVGRFFGPSRTVVIYVLSGVTGFVASSVAFLFLHGMPFIGGGRVTLGASASVFGLMGALLVYGHRAGSEMLRSHVRMWALGGLVMGLIIPFVDNMAHLGGFAGGYLCARAFDPLRPERPWHGTAALLCLLASLAAVAYSVATALPRLRP
jgi:membrane associated rhomboid family serine protease